MGQELPPGCSTPSRVNTNLENLRRRDPKSREFLRPLFGQVAVATVRNVLFNNVASLQNVDKLLASKVAEVRARWEQLQLTKNERQGVDNLLQDEPGDDCSLQLEGEQEKVDASYMLPNEELKHPKDNEPLNVAWMDAESRYHAVDTIAMLLPQALRWCFARNTTRTTSNVGISKVLAGSS